MLDFLYNMTLKLLKNRILAWKREDFAILLRNINKPMDDIT